MASTINASTSGVGGVITTADATGVLDLQTADVTRASVSSSGLKISRVDSSNEGGQLDLCRSSDNTSAWAIDVFGNTSTPSLRFIDNVAGSARMQIDASGNVQLPTANTSILNSSGNKILNQTGGTLQVLQAVKTDVFSVASSTFTDVTGMSISITPSSTSSKILVMVDAQIANSGADATMIKLVRNSTDIFIGDAAGSRIRTSTAKSFTGNGIESGSIVFLDSPSSTSSTTYKIQMRAWTGTAYLNRSGSDGDNGAHPRAASSITVMEIAG